jgi:hypothetical protein
MVSASADSRTHGCGNVRTRAGMVVATTTLFGQQIHSHAARLSAKPPARRYLLLGLCHRGIVAGQGYCFPVPRDPSQHRGSV